MNDYKQIIDTVKWRIPEYTIDEKDEDLPTVVFSFLSIFIEKAYETKNYESVKKCVSLMNDVSKITDLDVWPLIDEISIGLNNHSSVLYEDFKNRLSAQAKERFEESLRVWKSQGKNNGKS